MVYLVFGINIYHTLADFPCFWAKFHCYLWLNIEQIKFQSGPTGSDDKQDFALSLFAAVKNFGVVLCC